MPTARATRRPVEVVQFLGIADGDNVLELIAAGGWYTQVLSAAGDPSPGRHSDRFLIRARKP